MKFVVSSTDFEVVREFGEDAISNTLPENYGSDILNFSPQGLIGIQRKHFPEDFVSSMNDGRLTRETGLMAESVAFPLLLIEGKIEAYPDGTLIMPHSFPGRNRYTRGGVEAALWSIKYVKGIDYDFTKDVKDTVRYIRHMAAYFAEPNHMGLFHRPKAKGAWIRPTATDVQLWLLQSFEGIGPKLAGDIIKHFGGKLPLEWNCTLEEMKKVPRLGKKADELFEILAHANKTVEKNTISNVNNTTMLNANVVSNIPVETREQKLMRLKNMLLGV